MSTLIVDELFDGVVFDQEFKIFRDIDVAVIRPWVYLHGTLADGELQIEILEGSTVLLTQTLTTAEINAAKTETYAHGFMRFCFDALSLRVPEGATEATYRFKLSMINYTDDSNNFLGIVRNWENRIRDLYGSGVIGNQAPNDFIEPAGFEIHEYRRM